jgi:hypothetical protein
MNDRISPLDDKTMTIDEALISAVSQRLTREHLGMFVSRVFASVNPGMDYAMNWHIDLICEYLEACRRGEIRRLIINMPPRYLKSLIVNVAWSAYLLGHNPATRIISASYAQSLSIKHALDTRLILQSPWYRALFPSVQIARDQNEKEKIMTTLRGHRMAVSVGSAVTGEGGDVIIVDDPMNPQQAMHAPTRELVAQWFDHTLSTRLNDKRKGVIVVVMQRLHEEDLSGQLIRRGGYEVLSLPSVAESDECWNIGGVTFTRQTGEPLHTAREDRTLLGAVQRDMGSQAFQAQYQQSPMSETSSMIRLMWFVRFHLQGELHA